MFYAGAAVGPPARGRGVTGALSVETTTFVSVVRAPDCITLRACRPVVRAREFRRKLAGNFVLICAQFCVFVVFVNM